MSSPRLLQVGNVGQICGGTAACAWTVTRALPDWEHHVLFPAPLRGETAEAFAQTRVWSRDGFDEAQLAALQPDVILLHNQTADTWRFSANAPTVQYLHSQIPPAAADVTVCCSRWLAQQTGRGLSDVLWQGVPRPLKPDARRGRPGRLVVGRLCTPTTAKWPRELLACYAEWAAALPHVWWEFVGCPPELQSLLNVACRGQAEFHPAGWQARQRLWTWDVLLYHHPHMTESFGRTVAEASRAGCVPVVDRRGGFVEQVTEASGILCTNRGEFRQALRLLSDSAIRGRMSRQAQAAAEQRFSLARFARDLLATFAQAAALRAGNVRSAGISAASPRAIRSA